MGFIQWSDKFDVHVDAMNTEHKEIMRLMNLLWDKNEAKAPKADLVKILGDLGNYTVKHFGDEEKYMESINWPDVKIHKVIHQDLLKKFTEHKKNFESGTDATVPEAFFSFLKMWLSAHIQGIDVKYGAAKGKKTA